MRDDVLRTRLCDLLGTTLPALVAVPAGPAAAAVAGAVAAAGALPVVGTEGDAAGERFVLVLEADGPAAAVPADAVAVCVLAARLGGDGGAVPPGVPVLARVDGPADAVAAVESGADVLVVDAGDRALTLVPAVKAVAGDRPVVVAGVTPDGAVLAALLCLGASGVWLDDELAATRERSGVRDAEGLASVLQRMVDRARAVLSTAVWTR